MQTDEQLASLKEAMHLIADAVGQMPENCRDVAGNALLNMAAEAVAKDVGFAEAGRIFSRLGDLLGRGRQPPSGGALTLSDFDA
jgi:hypothetical protein